jgi:hypothetical protein
MASRNHNDNFFKKNHLQTFLINMKNQLIIYQYPIHTLNI